MYRVIWKEGSQIEIALSGELTRDEFIQVIHQLESLAGTHPHVSVLFDAADVEQFEFGIVWEELSFYREYKTHLERIAVVADDPFQQFVAGLFAPFADLELHAFPSGKVEEARNWAFPPRLP